MKLTFFGAAKAVTGSCHCVEVRGKKILIDCGLQQGRDERDNAVLELIRKKAGIVAGKPVRVRMGEERAGALGADDKLAQLIGDMAGYDNMKVQQ